MSQKHKDVLAVLTPVKLGPNQQADLVLEGGHLDAISTDADQLLREMFPDTCFALIEDWERLLGLPDSCTGQLPTVGQRIAAVTAKWGEKRKLSKSYLIEAAAKLGYTITITNYPARRYGQAKMGGRYIGKGWANAITVNAPATSVSYRSYAAAVYGEPYSSWGYAVLECAIKRLRPPQVYVIFSYNA